jgi:hypothetical protein
LIRDKTKRAEKKIKAFQDEVNPVIVIAMGPKLGSKVLTNQMVYARFAAFFVKN